MRLRIPTLKLTIHVECSVTAFRQLKNSLSRIVAARAHAGTEAQKIHSSYQYK